MSWAGVTVIWPMAGQSAAEAIGAHYGADVILRDSGDHQVEPTGTYGPIPEPSAAQDELLTKVEAALNQIALSLAAVERADRNAAGHLIHLTFVDDLGQLIDVSPGSATVRPGRDHDAAQFERTWAYITALAALQRSVVWEGDDDVLVDVSLSLESARDEYNWV